MFIVHSSPGSFDHFMVITLNSLLNSLLISTSLGFPGVLSYSFVWNTFLWCLICLICCLHSYVSGRLVIFLRLGDVAFCRKCLWVPAAHSLLVTRATCSRGAFYVGCVDPSVVAADYRGQSGRHGWTLIQWAARPSLVWRLLTADWWAGSQGSQRQNPRLGRGVAPG